jgi:hypothetical protein
MALGNIVTRTSRGLVLGAALLATVLAAPARPAHAVDPGAAVGIGLGALAVGTALGAAANPYYSPYYYSPYAYYPPAPAYYYPQTSYYPPRSCWDPYYGRYYVC